MLPQTVSRHKSFRIVVSSRQNERIRKLTLTLYFFRLLDWLNVKTQNDAGAKRKYRITLQLATLRIPGGRARDIFFPLVVPAVSMNIRAGMSA